MMMFKLTASEPFYRGDDENVKELKKLGFKFEKYNFLGYSLRICDDSDAAIEFGTLEELMEFVEKWEAIVLTKGEIEIYNGYRE